MNLKQALVRSMHRADAKIKARTEGLTHADSMQQLDFPANCMNWNLGHIMVYRHVYLGWIDGKSEADKDEFAMYGYNSPFMTADSPAMPLETILTRLDEVSAQVVSALEALPDAKLDEVFDEESGATLGDRLEFYLIYHETTHIGMLEILQELAHSRR